MNHRSISQLNSSARQLARELPTRIDLVAGIPRSGLLAANLLCLNLDVPMTDIEGLCEGRLLQTGRRYDGVDSFEDVETVLVVDDSVDTGRQMQETKRQLAEHDFPFDIEYGAMYISSQGHKHVDHWVDVVSKPRVFEWNMMHHPMLKNFCVDIDGVLCRDPTREENDDGRRYREFLTTVEPRVVPTQTIGWLVTCRLEKYRDETEAWLDRHGIEYDNLVMMDLPSKEIRQRDGNHAEYKADVYCSTGADLFIESSMRQATEICERSKKPVHCYGANQMLNPGHLDRVYDKSGEYLSRLSDNPISFSLKASKYILSEGYYTLSRLSYSRWGR
ncbi:phosphoribosyltransferase family protein [Halogeometricum borinquense]|uniref:Phosphoribosyl transferase family protein n=2 Tax=Halogeometricum borinquense (strain ATCC 700274 / DSM 11551 / JCM 10706 / KCTC 4070 / PR3) TaxID=469382 RepID=E4NNL9_HALBP|nr:phosphoribosyltransferase family protein [Halogeometricum borinquense]ADQ66373.1 phosphoribosyl transferase family protein [Halogeometricum borinquense DSM 11551]